jgi:integrase
MALYKRTGSKYYWMKFTHGGRLYQQSTKLKNRREAENYEAAFRTSLQLGSVGIRLPKDVPAFDDAVREFLSWSAVEHGPSSQKRYAFACLPLQRYFGKVKVDSIDKDGIEKFIAWRKVQKSRKTKDPVTRDTVNREIVILKKILRRLHESGVLRENPGRSISMLKGNDLHYHVITEQEERRYLMACRPQLQDVAALILETGMRPDEVYRIRRQDMHLENEYLQVVKGKTAAARRRVYLSKRAMQILTSRMNRFDGTYLFPQNDTDGQDATKTLNEYHRKTVRKLGLDFRLYDCRHTFATRAHEAGTDLLTLAAILGHASLKKVMVYAHPSEERKAEAIRMMQRERMDRKAVAG